MPVNVYIDICMYLCASMLAYRLKYSPLLGLETYFSHLIPDLCILLAPLKISSWTSREEEREADQGKDLHTETASVIRRNEYMVVRKY